MPQTVNEWGIPILAVPTYENYKPEKQKYNIFKIMYSALDKKYNPSEIEKSKVDAYLFSNILANNEKTLQIALMFTTNDIPVNAQYNMVRTLLPNCYIPYPKKKSKPRKDIDNLMKYYNLNERIANQYFDLISKDELKTINDKYKEGTK
ncbi:MAG: hypothetical protein KAI79_14030 [Bacteroidales bacterium]|nr:hypothetical protein [Bacteroidales bacterium]